MSVQVSESGHTREQVTNETQDFDKDATSSPEEKKLQGSPLRAFLRKYCDKMLEIGKEICILAFLAFTYAALSNDAPKISKSPSAYPFFPKGSVTRDYYGGELSHAISKARQSDIAFVMYYAPWDSESQEARKEFEIVARYLQKLVSFSAVNCWQPEGECRNQYSKVYSWPVLIAYPTHGRGIQYNGPKTALHMIRFLYSVMEPLTRITGLDLYYLRQKHDAVIVANVNGFPGSLEYSIIYSTALRFLERDPFQEIAFAVNLQSITKAPNLNIYTWNETITYSGDEWKSETLLNWIFKNILQVSVWASPMGSKSQQLSSYLQPGPALILFTPRNILYETVDYYDLLHEVALEYFYCKNEPSSLGTYLLSLGIHNNRIANYRKSLQPCTSTINNVEKSVNLNKHLNVVTVTTSNFWVNNSYCVHPGNKKEQCVYPDISHLIENKIGISGVPLKNKESAQMMYENMIQKQKTVEKQELVGKEFILESYKNIYKTSILTGFNDPRSPRNLLKMKTLNKCRLRNIAEKFSRPYFSESTVDKTIRSEIDISGFGCTENGTLSYIAMDSLKYHHFAESLGIDILRRHDKTATVIINEKIETHYLLEDKVTDKTLREFIFKYHENNLSRALYSSSSLYSKTHTYPVTKYCNNDFCIKELDSETFLTTVNTPNNAAVVLYHSKQCAFCSGISYKFLLVAKIFSMVSNLKFSRIDGELNSLPWEYTMESYPTILFFPDRRKSETRVFTANTPITITSLINFVLSNLRPPLKIQAMWSLCNQSKFEDENRSCILSIRLEVLTLIEKTLQEWRKADLRMKANILNELQNLRQLHLSLAHSSTDSIKKQMERLYARRSNKIESMT